VSPEADRTLVDRALAAELDVTPSSSVNGGSQMDLTFEFGSTKMLATAAVTDIAPFVPEFRAGALPRGVISASLWRGQLVTIDYPRWRVTIEPGALPVADGRDVFDLSPAREFTVPLSTADRSVPCRVDPLFAGRIVVPASFVKDLPLTGRSIPRGPVNTPKGALDVQEVQVTGGVRLGAFDLANPVIQVSERLEMALAGGQALAGFSLTYDLAAGRAQLQRQKGPGGRH